MDTPEAGQNIITRGLPKTGQDVEQVAGDDGTYEAGWWVGRLNATNRTRFIARTIGGDDIVLDRATGLMWAADGAAAGCNNGALITWPLGIAYANALNFAGFEDWRMPNHKELHSLLDLAGGWPLINTTVFPNTETDDTYWTSSTAPFVAANAFFVDFSGGASYDMLKTTELNLRCVRKGL